MSAAAERLPIAVDPADFEQAPPQPQNVLVIDVAGFEGPLDLLLKLARDQKLDLGKISVLALADQYLAFIEQARGLRLEIAADYLVMAAWLAYLKSRLLVPQDQESDEPSGEELAAALAARLRRLEAMREAGQRLMALPLLGADRFGRGMAEPLAVRKRVVWDAGLFDLLAAYSAVRLRQLVQTVHVPHRDVFSLQHARDHLVAMLGTSTQWATLDSLVADWLTEPALRASAKASALSASLELAREGEVELQQSAPLAPLYIRRLASELGSRRVANG